MEDIGKRVEEQGVLIATASININRPFSTFLTSREAVRGPGVHLPWPPIAISPPNDAFFLGHMQIETGGQQSPMLKGKKKKKEK